MRKMTKAQTIDERAAELAEHVLEYGLIDNTPGVSPWELIGYEHAMGINHDDNQWHPPDDLDSQLRREYDAGWLAACIANHDPFMVETVGGYKFGTLAELVASEMGAQVVQLQAAVDKADEIVDALPDVQDVNDEQEAESDGALVDPNPHHVGGMAGHDTWWDDDPERTKLDQDQGP